MGFKAHLSFVGGVDKVVKQGAMGLFSIRFL
jgi:hypothetical protein